MSYAMLKGVNNKPLCLPMIMLMQWTPTAQSWNPLPEQKPTKNRLNSSLSELSNKKLSPAAQFFFRSTPLVRSGRRFRFRVQSLANYWIIAHAHFKHGLSGSIPSKIGRTGTVHETANGFLCFISRLFPCFWCQTHSRVSRRTWWSHSNEYLKGL